MLNVLISFISLAYLFSPGSEPENGGQVSDVNPYQLKVSDGLFDQQFSVVKNDIESRKEPSSNGQKTSVEEEEESVIKNVMDETQAVEDVSVDSLESLYKDKDAFLSQVFEYERTFSQNSYTGDDTNQNPYTHLEGNIPVLISVPHTTKQHREDRIKSADIYTGSMSLFLHSVTNAHVIYSNQLGDDPNFIEGGVYKEKVKQLVEQYNIQYVIDLHGASNSHPFNVDLGTVKGNSLPASKVRMMREMFGNHGIDQVEENHTFGANTSGTITNYTYNKVGVSAVQVEVTRKYRDPRNDLDAYYHMLRALEDIVENITKPDTF